MRVRLTLTKIEFSTASIVVTRFDFVLFREHRRNMKPRASKRKRNFVKEMEFDHLPRVSTTGIPSCFTLVFVSGLLHLYASVTSSLGV